MGTAREEFIRQMADLRKRQQQAKARNAEDDEEFQLRHWTVPFKWGKNRGAQTIPTKVLQLKTFSEI